jgi:hypothetical protein
MSPGKVLLFLQHLVVSPGPRYTISFEWGRVRQRHKILGTQPVYTNTAEEGSVRYLVCHDQALEAVWSAKSLLADDRMRRWKLVFHDDGTLSRRDVALLHYHFPCAKVIGREEADWEMKDVLPPACKSLRDSLVLGLKLFDFAHFSYGRPYLALDTDVLFFRNPVELYEALSGPNRGVLWNQDPPEAVSLSHTLDEIIEKTGLRPERFNSGVLAIPRPFTQWQQIETWLHALGKPQMLWTIEQTIYGLIATSQGGNPLPTTYDVREFHWPDVISEHYYWRSRRNMYRLGYPALFANRLSYCRARPAE